MYKSRNETVRKFVEKLHKYRIYKDILTFLGLVYRDASLITIFYHMKICWKSTCLKWTKGHSDNDYRDATQTKSYTTGITMQTLKLIGQF